METIDQLAAVIALTLGVGWASGINLYAAVLTLGLLHNMGHMELPPGLAVVGDPLVIAAAGFMYCVEFLADKTPGVDTGWDTLHTFIRLPAGAVLAAAATGDVSPAAQIAAGLVGGTLAAGSHALKTGGRVMINTSPEPVSNWTASILEDVAVVAGVWAALAHPWPFLAVLAVFILLLIWLLPRIWRGIRGLFRTVAAWLRGDRDGGATLSPDPAPPALPDPQRGRER